MRYLKMIMGNADFEAGVPPSAELQQAMGAYIGKTTSEGVFIDGAGLLQSSKDFIEVHVNAGILDVDCEIRPLESM